MNLLRNVTLLAIVIVVIISCGDARQSELVGQWQRDDFQIAVVEFFEDGTFTFGGQVGTYSISDSGRLETVSRNDSDIGEYYIDGDTLVTTNSKGIRVSYTRISKGGHGLGDGSNEFVGNWSCPYRGSRPYLEITRNGSSILIRTPNGEITPAVVESGLLVVQVPMFGTVYMNIDVNSKELICPGICPCKRLIKDKNKTV